MAHYSVEFYVKSLARKTRIDLVIPSLNLHGCLNNKNDSYYQDLDETYPLLICLHGFGENEKSWQTNTSILNNAEEKGFAVCFVNGENKWFLNMGPIDNFYSFLEKDLLDFLYGNFRNLSSSKPLALCGVSMGGYGALYHYLKNTDKYLCCIALSPSTRPDALDEIEYGLNNLFLEQKNKKLNIYLSVGTNDFIYDASVRLDKFLKENRINAFYKFIPNANHSWNTWKDEFPSVARYLINVGFKKN